MPPLRLDFLPSKPKKGGVAAAGKLSLAQSAVDFFTLVARPSVIARALRGKKKHGGGGFPLPSLEISVSIFRQECLAYFFARGDWPGFVVGRGGWSVVVWCKSVACGAVRELLLRGRPCWRVAAR